MFYEEPMLRAIVLVESQHLYLILSRQGRPGADPGCGQEGAQLVRPKRICSDIVTKDSCERQRTILWPWSIARLMKTLEACRYLVDAVKVFVFSYKNF